MANIRSQIKRNRQNERRRVRNKSVRSEIRTRTKTAVTALDAGAEDAAEATPRRGEANRQGCRPGRHPQEPGGQSQVPPHAPGQHLGRGLRPQDLRRRRTGHRRPRRRFPRRTQPAETTHEHLEHRLRWKAAASPDVEVGLGQQRHRPADPGRAQTATLLECLARRIRAAHPQSGRGLVGRGDAGPVEAQHGLVVAMQDRQDLQGVEGARPEEPAQGPQGTGGVAAVDGIGEIPWRHRARFAQEGLELLDVDGRALAVGSSKGVEQSPQTTHVAAEVIADPGPGARRRA